MSAVTLAATDSATPVAGVVKGIISYTYWPSRPAAVRLCVLGNTAYQDQLLSELKHLPGRAVDARRVTLATPALDGCDALYLGPTMGMVAGRLARREVLAVSELDSSCPGGAMFCLNIRPDRVSFSLNLDAVARSGLRVDPKVLILGQAGNTRP